MHMKMQNITWTRGIAAKRAATLSDDFSHSLQSKLWAGISPYLGKEKNYKSAEEASSSTTINHSTHL